MSYTPLLDAEGVNALLRRAFPQSSAETMARAVEIAPGRALVVRRFTDQMLRPGGVVSGPVLMEIADLAAYALILGHVGEEFMAVTSSLTINFLRGAAPGDIQAEAQMLRLGRRIVVCEARIWTEGRERLAAQATVTYARAAS